MASGTKPSRVVVLVVMGLAAAALMSLMRWSGGGRLRMTVLAQSAVLADPTKLPVATTAQVELTSAYIALDVPAIAAGGSYLDPTTGVKIYKLTSATFPRSQGSWHHDYSEGGDEVSLPYRGQTRAVHVGTAPFGFGLLDFTPGVGVGNYREFTGQVRPARDGCFAFSSNPATPNYAYVLTGRALIRIDIRSMTPAPGGGFPLATSGGWLHQSGNDELFTWQDDSFVFGYEPSTATLKSQPAAGVNEPRVLRGGRYIGFSLNEANGSRIWDFQTNTIVFASDGNIPFAHQASLDDRWIGTNWNISNPNKFWELVPATQTLHDLTGPVLANLTHANGNWVQPGAGANAWALVSTYGNDANRGWLAPRGMVYVNAAGGRRLLGHPYNTSGDYMYYAFPKQSSDGRYVLFTSDMNGAGRSDLFLAELPTTGSAGVTLPPLVSMTAPAASATLTGTVTVAAAASRDASVVGVRFQANGVNIGSEVTTAPYAIRWDSASVADGPYSLTATARDAAGNSTTTAVVAVTVANSPPVISAVGVSGATATSATIAWTTNQASDSRIDYGLTSAYGSSTTLDTRLVTSHGLTLTGLTAATTYHYRVKSKNPVGLLAASDDFTLTTANAGGSSLLHARRSGAKNVP